MNLLEATPGRFRSAPVKPLLAAQASGPTATPPSRRVPVAEFPAGLTWINTAGPLRLSNLRGKFVPLDSWTYCCINCMPILPELKKLDHEAARQLVMGIGNGRFSPAGGC